MSSAAENDDEARWGTDLRILSVKFADVHGPVTDGIVQLGHLSAVIGANDSGKTRLVGTVRRALDHTFGTIGAVWILAELDEADIADISGITTVLDSEHYPEARARGVAPRYGMGGLVDLVDLLASEAAAALPGASIGHREEFLSLARRSRVFEFVPGFSPSYASMFPHIGDRLWTASWCVPPIMTMSKELASRVTALARDRGIGLRPVSEPQPLAAVKDTWITTSFMPRVTNLPMGDQTLNKRATDVVAEMTHFLGAWDNARHILESALEELADGHAPSAAEMKDPDFFEPFVIQPDDPTAVLLANAPGSLSPSATAVHICDLVGRIASDIAPAFLVDRYRIRVSVEPALLGESDAPVTVRLGPLSAGGSDGDVATAESPSFEPSDLGAGYHLWVELAVLQALARVSRLSRELVWAVVRLYEKHGLPSTDSAVNNQSGTEVAQRLAMAAAIRHVADTTEHIRSNEASGLLGRRDLVGHRELLVLDEPERHLHPRAHRQTAAWLRNLADIEELQVLMTTHSPAFMNMADALLYVKREAEGRATVEGISYERLTAESDVAASLGLDRGELLTTTTAFLFVEGPSDESVLKELYGERLRREGIVVLPIHGLTGVAQLVDPQIVLRFTNVPLALLVDDSRQDLVTRLRVDQEARVNARSHHKSEHHALARLFDLLDESGRDIQILPLRKKDIFFALDAKAVRERFPHGPHPYPGHDDFEQAFAVSKKGNEKYKDFRERVYGIPARDISWYGDVARLMRAHGDRAPALDDAIAPLFELVAR